jgi:S-formylglutathione hydrolase FrmB
MCALMLALRHPRLFQTIGDYGGLIGPRSGDDNAVGTTVADFFGGSQADFEEHDPATLLAHHNFAGMGVWFQVGTADPAPLQAAKELQPLAAKEGMATCIVEMPGLGHVGPVWRAGFEDSLPWISARLGLTPASPSDTRPCRVTS